MALFKCAECGKKVSDQAAACPSCGAPVTKEMIKAAKSNFSLGKLVLVGFFGLMVYQCTQIASRDTSPTASSTNAAPDIMSSASAQVLCEIAIKRLSRDPEKAEVPYVSDIGSGTTSHFSWSTNTKLTRMRNGLGLEVGTPASCTVDRANKKITSLAFDGKQLF